MSNAGRGGDPILFVSNCNYKPTCFFCEVNRINQSHFEIPGDNLSCGMIGTMIQSKFKIVWINENFTVTKISILEQDGT